MNHLFECGENNCEKCGFTYTLENGCNKCSKCGKNTHIEKSDNPTYHYDEVCDNKKCNNRVRLGISLNQNKEKFSSELKALNGDGTIKNPFGLCANCKDLLSKLGE